REAREDALEDPAGPRLRRPPVGISRSPLGARVFGRTVPSRFRTSVRAVGGAADSLPRFPDEELRRRFGQPARRAERDFLRNGGHPGAASLARVLPSDRAARNLAVLPRPRVVGLLALRGPGA